jgi:hypothetical protein
VTRTSTWTDPRSERSETLTTYVVVCSAPVGERDFDSEDARDKLVARSFSELNVNGISPPERRAVTPLLGSVPGEQLSSIEFVRYYVRLRFDRPALNLYVWPRIHTGSAILRRPDPGYADALISLIDHRLASAVEMLDLGLVLDFENQKRLSIPLDGTDSRGPEVAVFNETVTHVWVWGQPPFTLPAEA